MFDELILKNNTKERLETIFNEPKQSYMFVGPDAVGKFTAALHLAVGIINPKSKKEVDDIKSAKHKDLVIVHRKEENNSIKIDQIHELQSILKLKTSKKQKRIVIVRDAHFMTRSAQNALLKLFEEVPENTIIILTTDQQQKIISTIHSRAYHIAFYTPSKENVQHIIEKLNEELRELVEAFHIRNPGILINLSQNEAKYAASWQQIYDTAYKIIHGSVFEKMSLINKVTDDHRKTEHIMDAIGTYYRNTLLSSESSNDIDLTSLTEKLSAVEKAKHYFAFNVNHKLTISNLMLDL